MSVLTLAGVAETEALGARLARAADPQAGLVVYLEGDLGVGKTTLTRGLLAALGCQDRVKSPTYTLVEPYEVGGWQVQHLDLYRLAHPRDAEPLGVRELGGAGELVLIEWPAKGAGFLPRADLVVQLGHLAVGREARLEARSPRGEAVLARMAHT